MEHAKLDHSEMDHAEPNHGLHHQIHGEIWALLSHYAVCSGNSARTFWDNLSIPASRVKKSKRENRI